MGRGNRGTNTTQTTPTRAQAAVSTEPEPVQVAPKSTEELLAEVIGDVQPDDTLVEDSELVGSIDLDNDWGADDDDLDLDNLRGSVI